MKHRIMMENVIKNILIVIIIFIFYSPIKNFLLLLKTTDLDAVIIATSLLIMAFLFADYEFKYTSADAYDTYERILGHIITFTLMLGTGMLLEITSVALNLRLEHQFIIFDALTVLFYISLVLFDN